MKDLLDAIGLSIKDLWNSSGADAPYIPPWVWMLAGLVIIVLWIVPQLQAEDSPGVTTKNQFDRENEARKTLAQIIGGVLLILSFYSTVQTVQLQSETLNATRDGQITDRFTKAIEQLGSLDSKGEPNIEVTPRISRPCQKPRGLYARISFAYNSLENVSEFAIIPEAIGNATRKIEMESLLGYNCLYAGGKGV